MTICFCSENNVCWESEGRSSHELAIEVWKTEDRETGSGKVGQSISTFLEIGRERKEATVAVPLLL